MCRCLLIIVHDGGPQELPDSSLDSGGAVGEGWVGGWVGWTRDQVVLHALAKPKLEGDPEVDPVELTETRLCQASWIRALLRPMP